MSLVILIGLVAIGAIHAVRGVLRLIRASTVMTGRTGRAVVPAATGLVLSGLGLLVGWSAGLPVPIGYAGGDGGFALDPLACVFLLLLFAVALSCESSPQRDRLIDGHRDLRIAAMALTFLAGDAFLLACGAALSMLLPARLAGRRSVRLGVLSAFAVAGACTLLSGLATDQTGLLADPGFALLRAGSGTATILLPLLAVLSAAPLLGLWPMQSFRHQCAFSPVWVPITGMLLGLFLLLRLLLDLAGPVPSGWWGALLIVLGLGSALFAGVRGLSDSRAGGVIGSVLTVQTGLAVVAIGLCLVFKSEDLPVLAGSALDVVMLLLPTGCLGGLACLGLVRATESEAGSGLLFRLGGLARSMPVACAMLLLPVALLGALPPGCGFAALWLLLHCVLTAQFPLLGGLALPTLLLLLLVSSASVLGAVSLLRLCWIAALGRPRTPRGAAATDLERATLRRYGALLALPIAVGFVPGFWLDLATGQSGNGTVLAGGDGLRRPLLFLLSPNGTSRLFPLPTALLLGLCVVLCLLLVRIAQAPGEHRQRGWEGGAPPPPPWLPFGDPVTQIAPATLSRTLHQAIRSALGRPFSAGGAVAGGAVRQGAVGRGTSSPVGLGGVWRRLRSAKSARRWALVSNGLGNGIRVQALLLRHGPLLAAAVLAGILLLAASGSINTGPALR